ncbi:MAG: 2Fe-2S iron-sulfur cluster-binding protein [Pseudomonadota bacterium]
MTETARLVIARGTVKGSQQEEAFDVPFKAGQSVLDGLRWIRANAAPDLAFRFSCISANACTECMIRVDDKVLYACLARLEPREMHLAPLANKQLVRDLVTEIAPPQERLSRHLE